MNKIIKLSLIFSLLFSTASYHTQAQASVTMCAKKVIINTAILTAIYYIINAIATSSTVGNDHDIKNLKRNLRKFINIIDNTAFKINESIRKNSGININKYRKKAANILHEAGNAIEDGFDDIFLTQEAKNRKFAFKLQKKLYETAERVIDDFKEFASRNYNI